MKQTRAMWIFAKEFYFTGIIAIISIIGYSFCKELDGLKYWAALFATLGLLAFRASMTASCIKEKEMWMNAALSLLKEKEATHALHNSNER